MKHKKIWSIAATVLACTMVVGSFAGCGGGNDPGGETTKYEVTYVAGEGGGTAPNGGEYAEGATFTLAQNTFTYADHTFAGWNDGTTDYAAGATYTMPAKDVTFTAQWTADAPAGDETAPVITFAAGKKDEYTTTAGTQITLPSATANDNVDGAVDVEVSIASTNGRGATVTKAADGYTFVATAADEYLVSYYAIDEAENEAEEFITVKVAPVVAETVLEDGQNDLANLAQSNVKFVENFENGYNSPLAKGFAYNTSAGEPHATIKANEDSISGNSLFIDYSACAWNSNTQFWFGSLDSYLRSGIWTISMDVKVLGGTAPSGLYFSFIYDGDNSGENQAISLGAVGETKTLTFSANKVLDETKTWHFRIFFYTGNANYKYDDFAIVIDNIQFTVKEVVNAVVERTGTPKTIEATDLDGDGYTLTGADDNYTALTNMLYLDKSKVVGAEYLTAEQAENLTPANGFHSDYVILATEQLSWFESLNGLCTDSGYEYTVTMKVYAPNGSAWHMNHSDGASGHGFVQQASFKGATTFTMTFVGAAGNQKIGLYRDGGQNIFIGDITISRSAREDTSKTPAGYEVGKKWTKGAGDINLGNKGTSVTCSEVTLSDSTLLSANSGFDGNAIHFTTNAANVTMECFRGSNTIENGCTYKITFNLYIESLNGRLMINIDNNAFVDIISNQTGYQKITVNWKATKDVDFFSFYLPDGTGDFYCSSIEYELTALA